MVVQDRPDLEPLFRGNLAHFHVLRSDGKIVFVKIESIASLIELQPFRHEMREFVRMAAQGTQSRRLPRGVESDDHLARLVRRRRLDPGGIRPIDGQQRFLAVAIQQHGAHGHAPIRDGDLRISPAFPVRPEQAGDGRIDRYFQKTEKKRRAEDNGRQGQRHGGNDRKPLPASGSVRKYLRSAHEPSLDETGRLPSL